MSDGCVHRGSGLSAVWRCNARTAAVSRLGTLPKVRERQDAEVRPRSHGVRLAHNGQLLALDSHCRMDSSAHFLLGRFGAVDFRSFPFRQNHVPMSGLQTVVQDPKDRTRER